MTSGLLIAANRLQTLGIGVRPPSELVGQLLAELRQWQPRTARQHDDITLIVIDVL